MATAKQVRYASHLLARAGYPVRYMSSAHRDLGATMRQRQGRVDDWLRAMPAGDISALITRLQRETHD